MSRIEAPGQRAIPTDPTPEARPAAPAPRAKGASRPARGNEVRAYDGPPTGPSRGVPKQAAPPGAGAAVSAGELALRGGRAHPVPAEVPPEVYEGIRGALSRSWKDWTVSEADVKAVHDTLEKLPPGTYRAALERMESDGLLRTFVDTLEAGTRWAFLEQAERKGVVKRERGESASLVDAVARLAARDGDRARTG